MSSLDNIWKDKRLSLSIKLRIYLALVQSVLLYASETCTITVEYSKSRCIPHEMPASHPRYIMASSAGSQVPFLANTLFLIANAVDAL